MSYEAAVAHFLAFPGDIEECWRSPEPDLLRHAKLFAVLSPDGRHRPPSVFLGPSERKPIGDPLQVCAGTHEAWAECLTKRVRRLKLPRNASELAAAVVSGDSDSRGLSRAVLTGLLKAQVWADETVRSREWRIDHAAICPSDPWEIEDLYDPAEEEAISAPLRRRRERRKEKTNATKSLPKARGDRRRGVEEP